MKLTRILNLIVPTLKSLSSMPGISNIHNFSWNAVNEPNSICITTDDAKEIAFDEQFENYNLGDSVARALTILEMCSNYLATEGFTLRFAWSQKDNHVIIRCNHKDIFAKVSGDIEYGQVMQAAPYSDLGVWQEQFKRHGDIEVIFFAQGSDIVHPHSQVCYLNADKVLGSTATGKTVPLSSVLYSFSKDNLKVLEEV